MRSIDLSSITVGVRTVQSGGVTSQLVLTRCFLRLWASSDRQHEPARQKIPPSVSLSFSIRLELSDCDQQLEQIVNYGVYSLAGGRRGGGGCYRERPLLLLILTSFILQANLVPALFDTCHGPAISSWISPGRRCRDCGRGVGVPLIIVGMLQRPYTLSHWQVIMTTQKEPDSGGASTSEQIRNPELSLGFTFFFKLLLTFIWKY